MACKQQEFIPRSSGGWRSAIRVQAGLGSAENSLWVADADFSLCPHLEESGGGGKLSCDFFFFF